MNQPPVNKRTFAIIASIKLILLGGWYVVETQPTPLDAALSRLSVRVSPGPAVAVADVRVDVCGRTTSLTPSGGSFAGKVKIDCEGTGDVRIVLVDAKTATCSLGYVTRHAGTSVHLHVDGTTCRHA